MSKGSHAKADYASSREEQLFCRLINTLYEKSNFYRKKFNELDLHPSDIKGLEDLHKLPFTEKEDLRNNYPLSMQIAPDEEIVRIHSSSGTTGKAVLIPYTQRDVNNWAEMMARCMEMVGVTKKDRVQITPGYGLWTAGIGFQAGVERIGAMAIPTGPGNTERQLQMMVDLKTTVLIGTSSYGLYLAEEAEKKGLLDKIKLRIGIFGSERWGEKMRSRIEQLFGIDSFDIYGLTEIYGPGIAIDCPHHTGLHYWNDHFIFEIIDPETGKQLEPGKKGELVITTLTKEGMPLLRFRTRDITRIIPARCSCGSSYPMIDRITGRTDDMIKIKGVQVFPADFENVLKSIPEISSEYRIVIDRKNGKDSVLLQVERNEHSQATAEAVAKKCEEEIKNRIGITVEVKVLRYKELPRSEKKTKRIIDNRKN
ncbi:MAG: Phenylacetate--CoA ligase [Clostridia bacterium 41_269]|nr:MAG: Phenylacetate--CoA ligase [Clostridia bacterium 41_269]